MEISYIKRANQLVYMIDHAIFCVSFHMSLSKLGVCDIYVSTWGGELEWVVKLYE